MIDCNLQHLENGYVEEINNTLAKIVIEAVDKNSSSGDIKTAKLSGNTKQIITKYGKMRNANAPECAKTVIRKFNTELVTKTIKEHESSKIMRIQIAFRTKGICKL